MTNNKEAKEARILISSQILKEYLLIIKPVLFKPNKIENFSSYLPNFVITSVRILIKQACKSQSQMALTELEYRVTQTLC